MPAYDPQARPGDNLYTNAVVALNIDTGKLAWYFQYTPNDSWDYDEVGVHMLYDTMIDKVNRKIVGHFGRNGFYYSIDRTNGRFIKGSQYLNDVNWTKGLDPETGKPVEYNPKLDVQIYNPEARALRGDSMKRTCPTWHGGIAHQPTSYNPVKKIAYGVGTEGLLLAERPHRGLSLARRRHRRQEHHEAHIHERPLLRIDHGVRCSESQGDCESGDRHRDPVGHAGRRRAAWCLLRCRTDGSWPTTTRRSRSCGGSTSARR